MQEKNPERYRKYLVYTGLLERGKFVGDFSSLREAKNYGYSWAHKYGWFKVVNRDTNEEVWRY